MSDVKEETDGGDVATSGIPKAPFVGTVEEFVTSLSEVDKVLTQFQELISKYRFMQGSLEKTGDGLADKIPDIAKTLETVRFLRRRHELASRGVDDEEEEDEDEEGREAEVEAAKKPLRVHYELADTLYAEADVEAGLSTCCIWLGANVMLEYPLDEAEEMLADRLATAKASLQTTKARQEFVREQITTMEVNTARVYNWSVEQRRLQREQGDVEAK
ncbi:hypothetical protein PYCC9005_003380 [Savitreella phatthalungensis]